MKCWKPGVFFSIFHLWKAFRECHFVLRGPIQNQENCISYRPNIFLAPWEKGLEILVDLRNPMPKRLRSIFSQLCHRHFWSSPKMELVMEALFILFLQKKLRAHFQRFSLTPPWDLYFWTKAIGFHFCQNFHVESSCWVPATTKRSNTNQMLV